MCIYVFVIVIFTFLSILFSSYGNKTKNKKIYLFFVFTVLSLIAGLRSENVGIDTKQFTTAFDYISLNPISKISTYRYEYGFSFLCWILGKIFSSHQALIFFTSIFINFSILKFIYKNSENVYLSTLLYIFGNFYFDYMNVMRQAIAIAIILLGFEKLKENKNAIFAVYVFVASMFHSSAIITLILILVKKLRFNKKTIFIVLIFSLVSAIYGRNFFVLLSSFSERLAGYIGSEYDVTNFFGALINAIIYICSLIFGVFIISKNNKEILYEKKNINNTILGIISLAVIFSFLIMRVNIFNRFSFYFTIFNIIWLPNTISFLNNAKDRLLVNTLIYSLFLTFFITVSLNRPEWTGAIPYRFYWN